MDKILRVFQNIGNLHHAYLVVSEDVRMPEELFSAVKKNIQKEAHAADPEIEKHSYDTVGINEARTLKHHQSLTNIGGKQCFIVSCNDMTTEAQNALLKVLEAPRAHTHFFFIMPHARLLPTLLSRVHVIEDKDQAKQETYPLRDFFSSSFQKRLTYLEDLLGKDQQTLSVFLNTLERALAKEYHTNLGKRGELTSVLEQLYIIKKYTAMRGASKKILLEYLAYTIPLSD